MNTGALTQKTCIIKIGNNDVANKMVKENQTMRPIPSCYYDKTLLKLIDSSILDGYESYSSLDDTDKEYITAQCIEILGDDAANCLAESDNISTTLKHFTKFLRTADQSESYDLVQSMIKNGTDYFSYNLERLF